MASVYDFQNGDEIASGIEGCNRCDDAIRIARRVAAERGETVILDDDDGTWLIAADGSATAWPAVSPWHPSERA